MIDTAAGPRTSCLPESATSATSLSDTQVEVWPQAGGNLTCPRPHRTRAPRGLDARGGTKCRSDPAGRVACRPRWLPQMKTPSAVGYHAGERAAAAQRLSKPDRDLNRVLSDSGKIASPSIRSVT